MNSLAYVSQLRIFEIGHAVRMQRGGIPTRYEVGTGRHRST